MNSTKTDTLRQLIYWYLMRLGAVTWVDLVLLLTLILGNSLALSTVVSDIYGHQHYAPILRMPDECGNKGYSIGLRLSAIIHQSRDPFR